MKAQGRSILSAQSRNGRLLRENAELRAQLEEAQETLHAIRTGGVDALVVAGPGGDRVFTLRNAEHPYRLLVERMTEGAATLQPDGVILYANQAFAELVGQPLERVISSRLAAHVAARDQARVAALLRNAQNGSSRGELRLQEATGMPVPVLAGMKLLATDESTTICLLVTDLRERQRTAEILASEKFSRSILNQVVEAIVVRHADGRVAFMNAAARELTGLDPDQDGGALEHWGEAYDSEGRPVLPRDWALAKALQGRTTINRDVRVVRRDGRRFDLLVSARPLRDSNGVIIGGVASLRDVTDRKAQEEALRTSERRFRLALSGSPVVVWEQDRELRYTWIYNSQYGLPAADIIGRSDAEILNPAETRELTAWKRVVMDTGKGLQIEPTLVLGGKARHYEMRLDPMFDAAGRVSGIIGAATDMTSGKENERALAAARDQLAAELAVTQRLHDLSTRLAPEADFDSLLREILEAAVVLQGTTMGCLQLLDREANVLRMQAAVGFAPGFLEHFRETSSGAGACGLAWARRKRLVIADITRAKAFARGPFRKLAREAGFRGVTTTPLFSRTGEVLGTLSINFAQPRRPDSRALRLLDLFAREAADLIEVARRQSERRRSQELLAAANRRLADALARTTAEMLQAEQRERERTALVLHDHLQPLLVAARMRLGLLNSRMAKRELTASLGQVEAIITQGIDMSRSLSVALNPPVLNERGLAAALIWLAQWMNRQHGLRVKVSASRVAEPADETLRALCFQTVRELLLNVVKHSGTSQAQVRLRRIRGGELELTVADRGRGFDIAAWRQGQPGEKSFGLYHVEQRFTLLGAQFALASVPERGTLVTIRIPPTPAPAASAVCRAPAANELGLKRAPGPVPVAGPGLPQADPGPSQRRRIRVMLADDHQILRESLGSALRLQPDIELVGEAENGRVAVELARRLQPDVILMDVSMPQMDGIQATQRIVQEQPRVRIIGLSMHEKADKSRAMRAAGARAYLPKTLPIAALLRHIRSRRSA